MPLRFNGATSARRRGGLTGRALPGRGGLRPGHRPPAPTGRALGLAPPSAPTTARRAPQRHPRGAGPPPGCWRAVEGRSRAAG